MSWWSYVILIVGVRFFETLCTQCLKKYTLCENIPTNRLVKEFWKSVHICHSYYQTSRGILYWDTALLQLTEMSLVICRHYRLEAELLAEVNWRVRWDDIRFGEATSDGRKAHALDGHDSRRSRVRRLWISASIVKRKPTIIILSLFHLRRTAEEIEIKFASNLLPH